MKLGRTISKKTPLALFAKKSGLTYKQIAECTGLSESTLKKAGAGIEPLPTKAALAIASRFELSLPFLLGEKRGRTVLHADGEEWSVFGGSAFGTVDGHATEHRREALLSAIQKVADEINYRLPGDRAQSVKIADAVRWFNPFSTDEQIREMRPHMQEPANAMKAIYARWERRNAALKKAERIPLLGYFERAYNAAIRKSPRLPRRDLVERFKSLLVAAGSHPRGPLIAGEIFRFLIETESRLWLTPGRSGLPSKPERTAKAPFGPRVAKRLGFKKGPGGVWLGELEVQRFETVDDWKKKQDA